MLKAVSDTTPIIALSSISRLDILGKIYDKIVIPKAVKYELLSGGEINV